MICYRKSLLCFFTFSWISVVSWAQYSTTDYLIVKKKLDTINADFSKRGYYPTVTTVTNGKKSLTFFGASHVRSVEHPQFKDIQKSFLNQIPQIAFHEGDSIPPSRRYASDTAAFERAGERGLLKYLCDQSSVLLLVGDMNTREEFAELTKRFPNEPVYLYMAIERFLNPFQQGYYKGNFEAAFQKEFIDYLQKYGFPLSTEAKTTGYLRKIYRQYFNRSLNLKKLVQVQEYYLTDTGLFGRIGRASKDIRDQALLSKIDQALNKYDRVFVVFGGSHWVAVQPALQYIINKPRP